MLHSCMNWTPATPISPHSALFTGPAIFPAFDFQPSLSSKSLPLNLFADPHPLNLYAAILYKNNRGGGFYGPTGRTTIPVRYFDLSPLFATLKKTPGVWGYSSHSGTRPLIAGYSIRPGRRFSSALLGHRDLHTVT